VEKDAEKTNIRAIRNDRVCFACATPIPDKRVLVCPNCGGVNLDDRRTRPANLFLAPRITLPAPFEIIEIELGASILLSGDAGSGKTTICLAASAGRDTLMEASEQQQRSIATNWRRIHKKEEFPAINGCYSWENLEEDIRGLQEGSILIVDSVSQLSESHDSAWLVQSVIERVRTIGAIAFFIAHYTKDGQMLGPNMLRHLVDVVCHIPNDDSGMRRLALDKNRFGGLTARYFSISDEGVGPQTFDQAYSVEGPPGKYRLHLHPLGSAKWAGMLNVLAEAGVYLEGYATAALPSAGYRSGYAVPPDWKQRKAFAESHGLNWLTPDDANQMLADKADTEPPPSSPKTRTAHPTSEEF
jgi:predicted nucleic acid-binding Zn ribbon protein